jgi:hypothetical protein
MEANDVFIDEISKLAVTERWIQRKLGDPKVRFTRDPRRIASRALENLKHGFNRFRGNAATISPEQRAASEQHLAETADGVTTMGGRGKGDILLLRGRKKLYPQQTRTIYAHEKAHRLPSWLGRTETVPYAVGGGSFKPSGTVTPEKKRLFAQRMLEGGITEDSSLIKRIFRHVLGERGYQ